MINNYYLTSLWSFTSSTYPIFMALYSYNATEPHPHIQKFPAGSLLNQKSEVLMLWNAGPVTDVPQPCSCTGKQPAVLHMQTFRSGYCSDSRYFRDVAWSRLLLSEWWVILAQTVPSEYLGQLRCLHVAVWLAGQRSDSGGLRSCGSLFGYVTRPVNQ